MWKSFQVKHGWSSDEQSIFISCYVSVHFVALSLSLPSWCMRPFLCTHKNHIPISPSWLFNKAYTGLWTILLYFSNGFYSRSHSPWLLSVKLFAIIIKIHFTAVNHRVIFCSSNSASFSLSLFRTCFYLFLFTTNFMALLHTLYRNFLFLQS